jgi:DNA adenine methylase
VSTIARPPFRWTGNKHDLLDQLRPLRPRSFDRYFEPFLGAGAMFWDIARAFDGPCFLSDANTDLVLTYRVIRDDVDGLIDALSRLAAAPATQENYLDRRAAYNARNLVEVDRAAHFIFLMQTCFNGVYRVSRNGYNVGWNKRPTHSSVLNADLLRACSAVLRRGNVHIDVADWRRVVDATQPGDFVYLDSPYVPVSETANFTGYTADGFAERDHRDLAAALRMLARYGVQCMLSNSDTPLVRDLYAGFEIRTVYRGGRMNCKGDGRGRVPELVICGGYTT